MLLPTMMRMIDNEHLVDDNYISLQSQNISVVEVGAYSQVFANLIQFLGIKTLIITDIDSVDNDGKQCKVSDGLNSCNSSINFFLGTKALATLKSSTSNILSFDSEKWIKDDNGYLNVTYQCDIEGYYPRTFEDAFFAQNKKFIIDNIDNFASLKNKSSIQENLDPYDFSNENIIKKTTFALDILYYSTRELNNWTMPKYIKDGLEWISKN